MLISWKHDFVFIHIYKNAGTSITEALLPFSMNGVQQLLYMTLRKRWRTKANSFLKKINQKMAPQPFRPHITAKELVKEFGEDLFNSLFSFAIVRNPWDWQVSLYNYILFYTKHKQHDHVKDMRDFDEYIRWRCAEDVWFQKDFVCSENGELLVNFLGRFENLNYDFQTLCSQMGISTFLPRLNISNSTKLYQQYYTNETKTLVEQTFKPDIELFGYSFE